MDAQVFFENSLGTIDRVIGIVSRRARLFGADAEDFASSVKLALIDDDYAILRRYEGRSSLDTFLTVVIGRLLADARTREKGRWHASSEAQRLGPAAVLVETLVRRDGRSLDEAWPHVRAAHPELTRDEAAAILERLPDRTSRPRAVELEAIAHAIAGGEAADARTITRERERVSGIAGSVVRELVETFPVEDRLLVRLRFGRDLSIADISRMMDVPQRPLYRRLETLLMRMRTALANAGIDRRSAADLVGLDVAAGVDFGLNQGKSDSAGQSIHRMTDHAGEKP